MIDKLATKSSKPIHQLTVARKFALSPNFTRIELTGAGLSDFPQDAVGGYVKLLLPKAGAPADPTAPKLGDFIRRSFTIRALDPDQQRLTLDFAHHAADGPAMVWLQQAAPQQQVTIAGPGPVKMLDPSADWVFLAGDMAALPAIAANLERLPATMVGHAVVEVLSADDRIALSVPEGIQLTWVVHSEPGGAPDPLVEEVQAQAWLPGRPSVWCAAEFSAMKALRHYFRHERSVPREYSYISSYWKAGATDEQHKSAKREDAEASGKD